MKFSVYFIGVVILLSSCSSRFSLQKRKYTKGFYFAVSHNADLAGEKRKNETKKAYHKFGSVEPSIQSGAISEELSIEKKSEREVKHHKKNILSKRVKLNLNPIKKSIVLLKNTPAKRNTGKENSGRASGATDTIALLYIFTGIVIVLLFMFLGFLTIAGGGTLYPTAVWIVLVLLLIMLLLALKKVA